MPATLTIQTKVLGQRGPFVSDWSLELPATPATWTLRDLISLSVRHEVMSFHERQEQNRLTRVLSPAEIATQTVQGKVAMGQTDLLQEVNAEDAVVIALQGFEDGVYFVFLNGKQCAELDQPVALSESNTIMFVRLVALVGG